MKTYRFSFRSRNRFIDATDIFQAMVKFTEEYPELDHLKELVIHEL